MYVTVLEWNWVAITMQSGGSIIRVKGKELMATKLQ